MPRRAKGISATMVKIAKPGRYGDGAGLYLMVRGPQAKFWTFRYVRAIEPPQYNEKGKRKSKMREIGLGPATGRAAVSLADARVKALALYREHKAGADPLADRAAGRSMVLASAGKQVTFEKAAFDYIEAHRSGWSDRRQAQQWESSLRDYAFPKIGKMLVSDIETSHVEGVLLPIWATKRETASRVRGRIESILGREKALKHRSGENPARWKENLDAVLPKLSKTQRQQVHYAAMSAKDIGDFMVALRADNSTVARALEFCILSCTRTAETLNARFDEIDLDEKVWTIPGAKMKSGREHRVALSSRAIAIVKEMQADAIIKEIKGNFVFSSPRRGGAGPLSPMVLLTHLRKMGYDCTVHGFRSTFRDWVSEQTTFSSEVAEMALAHVISNKVEAAYRKGDLLAKRFDLAEKWAQFLSTPSRMDSATVVNIRGAK
jgi:integrase